MSFEEFVFIIKEHNQYWNLKRRVLRRLSENKKHRKERIKQIVKRKMKHIK
jgi:hypothetical protein